MNCCQLKGIPFAWFTKYFYVQNFFVDIRGPTIAFLPVLAFEGGTRRNIPKFEVRKILMLGILINCEEDVVHTCVNIFS